MFKSVSPFEACNYRPINFLNVVSKVLKGCIYDNVYDHCIHSISKNQHGFMKKRSICTNLLPYLENVYRCVDERFQTVSAFYSDFAKVFVKVSHKLLLAKMHAFGIRGEALGVISSYLTNCHQFVRFDSVKSDLLVVKSGVPQGSIVGLLFFIIFIHDMVCKIEHSLPYLLADDQKLFHTNLTDMQNDLLKFQIWVAKMVFIFYLSSISEMLLAQLLTTNSFHHAQWRYSDLFFNCQRSWNSDQEQFIFPLSFE